MDNEIFSLHFGKAGIRAGISIWDQFRHEFGLDLDGMIIDESSKPEDFRKILNFYDELSSSSKFTPRAIFSDHSSESSSFEDFGKGRSHNWINSESLYFKPSVELYIDTVRKSIEKGSNFQGFLTYYSAGCIEDALFANKVLPVLKEEYSKNANIAFTIFPKTEQKDEFVGDPYQVCTSLMAIKEMRVNCSVNFALDNQAIHDICQNSLKLETPKFDDYNGVISKTVSTLTSQMRLQSGYDAVLNDYSSELVPFPNFNLCCASFAPFITPIESRFEVPSVMSISSSLFKANNFLAKVDPFHGKYLACSIVFQGNYVPKDIGASIASIKTKKIVQFGDSTPYGFKCCIAYSSPAQMEDSIIGKNDRAAGMMCNTTSIGELISRFDSQAKTNLDIKKSFAKLQDFGLTSDSVQGENSEDLNSGSLSQDNTHFESFKELMDNIEELKQDCYELTVDLSEESFDDDY